MRWIKRGLWLLAWGVWAWLGAGLYRELPRSVGPVVRELPIGVDTILGFVKNERQIATWPPLRPWKVSVRVFDATTGTLVHRFPMDETDHYPAPSGSTVRTHGVVLAHARLPRRGLEVLDLVSGRRIPVTDRIASNESVHPTKPWVAFREHGQRRAAIVDWTTGAEVFSRPTDPDWTEVGKPIFVGASDRLFIPVWSAPSVRKRSLPTGIEVWRLGSPNRLERRVSLTRFGEHAKAIEPGRLAWVEFGVQEVYFDVFDVDADRLLASVPPATERGPLGTGGQADPVRISPSGRRVLRRAPEKLWDIDLGKVLWEPEMGHGLMIDEPDGAFGVFETWYPWWTFGMFRGWNTVAHRDLETGAVLDRVWEVDAAALAHRSADGTLATSSKGVVYELPLRVNWKVLIACQAILAMPLVLLWAALRWRRRGSRLERLSN